MASIQEWPGGRWRAQVKRCGRRMSRVFETRDEASRWAASREAKALAMAGLGVDGALASSVPRRVLEAIGNTEYSCHEIVGGAMPAPSGCGVYFLVLAGEVVYVGQTTNLLARLCKHQVNGVRFDSFNFVSCEPDRLDEIEGLYIEALLPRLNRTLRTRPRRKRRAPAA